MAGPIAEKISGEPVNAYKSLMEIIRVVRDDVAIMLMQGDVLVGSLALIRVMWWYNDVSFLTDRWHNVIPALDHSEGAKLLLDEGKAIAKAAGLVFIHSGKVRDGKSGIMQAMPQRYGE